MQINKNSTGQALWRWPLSSKKDLRFCTLMNFYLKSFPEHGLSVHNYLSIHSPTPRNFGTIFWNFIVWLTSFLPLSIIEYSQTECFQFEDGEYLPRFCTQLDAQLSVKSSALRLEASYLTWIFLAFSTSFSASCPPQWEITSKLTQPS